MAWGSVLHCHTGPSTIDGIWKGRRKQRKKDTRWLGGMGGNESGMIRVQ